jgi:Tol biopolymer transport system component
MRRHLVGGLVVAALGLLSSLPSGAGQPPLDLSAGLSSLLGPSLLRTGLLDVWPSTTRVSVTSDGLPANRGGQNDWTDCQISADGRYVMFGSDATNLVPGDTNRVADYFVHDRQTGQTRRVNIDSAGNQASGGDLWGYSISSNGRYVAFSGPAANLVPGDTNGCGDVFVRDCQTGQTTRVSVSSAGIEGNGDSTDPCLSGNGRYVAFFSTASNLVPDDTNGHWDIFLHDRQTGRVTLVSVDSAGNQATGNSWVPSLTPDGRYVGFVSSATNLVSGDTNACSDSFVHDCLTGETTRVNVTSGGRQSAAGGSTPRLSADGRFAAFSSWAYNLVRDDLNWVSDGFVHDRRTGRTVRVSVDSEGHETTGRLGAYITSISANGRWVDFQSDSNTLVPGDYNGDTDAFVHDCLTGETTRISVDSAGQEINDGMSPSISADGRYVAFCSRESRIPPRDANRAPDVFVRDRGPAPACRPDMWVRRAGHAGYVGDDVYNTTGENQTRRQRIAAGQETVVPFQVQNDSTVTDRFTIRGTAGGEAWTVSYFDRLVAGHDITAEVTGLGWETAPLASGAKRAFRAVVRAAADAAPQSTKAVLVTAISAGDAAQKDAVKAVSTVAGAASGGAIVHLIAVPTAHGAQVVFTLSAPASVEAHVLNVAGRPVRTLVADKPFDAGTQTLLWDRRSDTGLAVPSGLYLLHLTAYTPDGTQSSAVSAVALR